MHVDADLSEKTRQPGSTARQRASLWRIHFDDGDEMILLARSIENAHAIAKWAKGEAPGVEISLTERREVAGVSP